MQIILEDMHFYAYHGYYEQERVVGNDFVVTVAIDVADLAAQETDNLQDTLNYQLVYDAVADEMRQTSQLLEHVARRILVRVKSLHSAVQKVQIRLSKMNPPLGGQVRCVTLVLEE